MNVKVNIFKRVTHFKYLGQILTQNNNLQMEISTRIQKGNKYFCGLGKILSSRAISVNLKIQMSMTLIQPIVLYASETWPHRKPEETRLKLFERRILQKIYSPCVNTHTREWKQQHNYQLKELFQRLNIGNEIK